LQVYYRVAVKPTEAAHYEAQHPSGEFMALAGTTPVPPTIDHLFRYQQSDAPEVEMSGGWLPPWLESRWVL